MQALRKPQVLERVGIKSTFLYEMIKAGRFPSPVKLGPKRSVWLASEVDAWLEARAAERTR